MSGELTKPESTPNVVWMTSPGTRKAQATAGGCTDRVIVKIVANRPRPMRPPRVDQARAPGCRAP